MKTVLVTLLFLLGISPVLSQSVQKTPCKQFDNLMKEGRRAFTKNFQQALNMFLAAKTCDPNRGKEADEQIVKLFSENDAKRQEAENERRRAENSERLAREATDQAIHAVSQTTAFVWAAEADKIIPAQGIRLLQEAQKKDSANNAAKEQLIKLVNRSARHQFREKNRIPSVSGSRPDRISFSKDGKWIIIQYYANSRSPNKAQVWDVATGSPMLFLKDQPTIKSAYFSNDSKWLVIQNSYNTYQVWDVIRSRPALFLSGQKPIHAARFSNDSKWLSTAYSDNTYGIWAMDSGKPSVFLKNQELITYINFSDSSKWLTVQYRDNTLHLWDLSEGKRTAIIQDQKPIIDSRLSDDGKWLITKYSGNKAQVWEIGRAHV